MNEYNPVIHPRWAIEEALKRSGSISTTYEDIINLAGMLRFSFRRAILSLAAFIAKYEQQPVDKAALILADYYEGLGIPTRADRLLNGSGLVLVTAFRAAMKKNGIEI